jgi:hypothetical protein
MSRPSFLDEAVLYHDYRSGSAKDLSGNSNDGALVSTSFTGDGIQFPTSAARITAVDSVELQLTELCLVALGDVNANYSFFKTNTTMNFYDGTNFRSVSTGVINKKYFAVNAANTETPEGFVDGLSVGNFSGTVALAKSSEALEIGNVLGANVLGSNLKAALIFPRKLTATEHSQLYGYLSSLVWPTKPQATATVGSDSKWKTDFGAHASVAAVSSGYLENTQFQVASGSFKVVDDTISSEQNKAIECIANGSLTFPSVLDGLDTGWTGYEDTGSGYVSGTLSITSLAYGMTAGDKISLGSINGNYAIVKTT